MNASESPQPTPLIPGYRLDLVAPACVPGADRWSATAEVEADITEALPYLNAALDGAEYYADAKVLVWKSGGRKYAFRPREVAVAPVEDRDEAGRLIAEAVKIVNDVWRRRADLTPSFDRREPPNVMEIYKLLPRTNCKQCGQPTCMAFAASLRGGGAEVSSCAPLVGENRDEVLRLLGGE